MMLFNFFFKHFLYLLPVIVTKKIIKFSKIFFLETNFKKLPVNNHPLNNFIKINNKYNYIRPFISYTHLPDLLSIYIQEKKKLVFYDYGAGNLNLYFYLKKKLNKFIYFFHDQEILNKHIKLIKFQKKLKSLRISDLSKIKKIDFAYFGSSIQYLENYKKKIEPFFKKSKYIIISASPFFENYKYKRTQKSIVMKQLNLFPIINYLYGINYIDFISFMKKNNYSLLEKNINRVSKNVNFKNFKNKFKKIDMLDLIFVYNKKI